MSPGPGAIGRLHETYSMQGPGMCQLSYYELPGSRAKRVASKGVRLHIKLDPGEGPNQAGEQAPAGGARLSFSAGCRRKTKDCGSGIPAGVRGWPSSWMQERGQIKQGSKSPAGWRRRWPGARWRSGPAGRSARTPPGSAPGRSRSRTPEQATPCPDQAPPRTLCLYCHPHQFGLGTSSSALVTQSSMMTKAQNRGQEKMT